MNAPALVPVAATPLPRKARVWPLPTALLILHGIPLAFGVWRLASIGGLTAPIAGDANAALPVPIGLHVMGASAFAVIGTFQLVPALRRRAPKWHRRAGWIAVSALVLGTSAGLWVTALKPLVESADLLLALLRALVGSSVLTFTVWGVQAARSRDFHNHGRWFTRAYALMAAAGTQSFLLLPWVLVMGDTYRLGQAIVMGLAWLLNAVFAEYQLSRTARRGPNEVGLRPALTGTAAAAGTALPTGAALPTAAPASPRERRRTPSTNRYGAPWFGW